MKDEEEEVKIVSVVEVEDDFPYQNLPTLSYVFQSYSLTLIMYPFNLPDFWSIDCFGFPNFLWCVGCVLSKLLAESFIDSEEEE